MNPKDIQRFFSKIKQNGNCWEWVGSKSSFGYGQFNINNIILYAHRLSYELFIDKIPKGLQIDHLCRNRACVNPDHLEVVTQKENCLRGDTGKHNKIKTHCPRGHEYSKIKNNGERICQLCRNTQSKIHYKKKMEMKLVK